ncbi:extracellular solute-binding protein [Cellulomonas shaoxiangyii]|uniref:Extracellular solute-binding protein n=1 Tax=Cellulomonas shaoxiangyii TaxID=2566013 RepID=A0A4P7SL86_9CELL|nr:extracellular solute-binding protein [Cellulomonas shaoxiangyii]QCB93544.1 extracellular solute-binding protein [Cellulomonas shaoxiangyii]TGY86866.1 extracellular solute-binding protein [Cellulomonas shaoxiangyii]
MARSTRPRWSRSPGQAPGRRAFTSTTAVVAASTLLLAGCTGGGDDSADGSGDSSGGGELTILVVKHPLTRAMEDMAWVAELEKAADVSITWEEVSADWDQKKSTMLAAGDTPDLIIGGNAITDSDLATFRSLFEDLSDDMDALPNVQAMFEEVDGVKEMATQADGSVYALPSWKEFWPQAITRQYINQQWLDNLGLATPTTWDELYDVLLAFKEQDANGNGDPADEIPMDWSPVTTTGYGYFQPTALLGSLGLPITGGGGTGYFVEDGQVGNFLADERWKEVLTFLNRAYAAGLVNTNVITQDYSAYQSIGRGSGDTAAVGFSWGWTASDRFGAQLAPQYASMAPLPAEAGQSEPVTWSYDFENLTPNHVVVSAQTDAKDAALRVVNEFYGQDMSMQVLFGDFGTNVEKAGDDAYEVLPPADGTSDPSTWKWTSTLADGGPLWIRSGMDVTLPTDLAEAVEQSAPLADAVANVDADEDVLPPYLKMSTEDLSTIALNNSTILNISQTKFAEFVTSGGIEAGWDDYVAQLEASGLEQNVELYQKYYDEAGQG